MKIRLGVTSFAILVLVLAHSASATVVVFNNDLAGFDALAGTPPVSLDFDSIISGTNLAGDTESGIAFENLAGGTTLEVVVGAATFTGLGFGSGDSDNRLFATSGAKVLSPGGIALVPGPAAGESDSMRLLFDAPVSAFGLDVLFQSLDGASFFSYALYDSSDFLLLSAAVSIPVNPNGPNLESLSPAGGTVFLGFVSDSADIARIDFLETDANAANPDANVGYDTFRYFVPVPEPSSIGFLALAIAALAARPRRK
jgi:hypothetical protein